MNTSKSTYDVVIAGAGIAGCAVALHIKKNAPKINVLMVEYKHKPSNEDELRIGETIPPQTGRLLQRLGLMEKFKSQSLICSYGTSAAWGSDDLYTNPYLFSANGYGWHIDRTAFDRMMIDACIENDIAISFESKLVSCQYSDELWNLQLHHQEKTQTIQSRFLIDASGKQSSIAKLLGVHKNKYDQLIGLYKYYSIDKGTNKYGNGSMVETCAHGWWYSSVLPNNKMVVSFMTDADIASSLRITKDDGYLPLLQDSIFTGSRVTDAVPLTTVKAIASHTHLLDVVVGHGWLAVGDAASSYDPISSLGIYKSLAMSAYAAYATLDYLNGNVEGLAKYNKIIRADYNAYQVKRDEYYGMEKRFTNSIFWNRRQQHFSQKN